MEKFIIVKCGFDISDIVAIRNNTVDITYSYEYVNSFSIN